MRKASSCCPDARRQDADELVFLFFNPLSVNAAARTHTTHFPVIPSRGEKKAKVKSRAEQSSQGPKLHLWFFLHCRYSVGLTDVECACASRAPLRLTTACECLVSFWTAPPGILSLSACETPSLTSASTHT